MKDISNERIYKYKKINIDFLNTLDLFKYVETERDIRTIVENISNDYNNTQNLPQELEGNIFNFIDDYEVAKYLADRYNFAIGKSIVYTLYPKFI